MQKLLGRSRFQVLTAVLLLGVSGEVVAQEVMQVEGSMGRGRRGGPPPGVVTPDGHPPISGQPGQPQPGTPPEGEKKEGEEKPEEPKDDDKSVVNRPDKPPTVPDPKELEAKPDEQGRIQFNFTGQTWPDVLQWLANVADLSLDWQELPGDYLNLTTQHSYSLPEARDLINRHLQARGYTMLLSGEVLSVFKTDKLDPSLVPRVDEEGLYDSLPHDWVKVSFSVPEGMDVAKAAEDVKQVLSTHAKVLPLASTKRLLLIGAVANLRDVSALLNEERLAAGDGSMPKEFVLKHRRAEKVIDILYVILGLDPNSRPTQMELQLQQQKLQLMQQMQQGGKDVSSLLKKDGPPVYLAFNRQNNSILANAPKEHLDIIARSIKMLDVPTEGEEFAATGEGPSAFGSRTSKSYKLKTVDPRSLVSTLEEIGDLDPLTELRADNSAKILFARASQSDHERIAEMIQELDDSETVIEVFRLRRHPADAVAGTIMALMGKEEKKEDNSRRRYYYPWDRDENEQTEDSPSLKVDADVENNRLIVRGTVEQMAEVRAFLTKLGELGTDVADQRAVRVLDGLNGDDLQLTLDRLKAAWPAEGAGELIIRTEEPAKQAAPASEPEPTETKDRTTRATRDPRFQLAADTQTAEPAVADTEQPASLPPVTITVTNDGRIVLSSTDPTAVEQVQDLLESLAPPPVPFKEFRLKYIPAYTAYLNLVTFLKEELKDDSEREYSRDWWSGDWIRRDKGTGPAQMSKRQKLTIDYDTWTNSILVRHATAAQLTEIEGLIDVYDQPPRAKTIKNRRTEAIKVKYSKASVIGAALKEVYRDLLSSRDKEFDSEDEKRSGTRQEGTTVIRYSVNGSGETKETLPLKAAFEGALAVGIDDTSNTLLISAQTELFDSVVEMVRILDEQARPSTSVQVVQLDGNVNANSVRQALAQTLGSSWVGGRPEQPQDQAQRQDRPSDRDRERWERRRRDRDRGRDRDRDRRRRDD